MSALVNLNIPAPQDPDMAGAAGVLASAECYVVADHESYELAGAQVRAIAGAHKRLEEKRLGITRKIDESKRAVMDLFRPPMEALERARGSIERKMLGFRQEEQRRIAEAQRAAAEAAERDRLAREAQLLKEAEDAQKAGNAEVAQAKLEEAAAPPPPPPVLMQEAPKAAGTSVRALWRAECTDLDALIKAAAAGHQLARACLVADPKVLGAQARALKDGFKVPGIRVWSEDSMAARS